jgi:hypothetical protein
MASPDASQTLETFFDLELGGLKQIYKNPNIPIDMTLTIDTVWTVSMTLWDQTGFEVEPYIWQSKGGDGFTGKFQFGYQKPNLQSPLIPFQITNYDSKVEENSFRLTILGNLDFRPNSSCNQANGTVTTVFQKFCDTYGWTLQIDPPLGPSQMMETGRHNIESTELREMQFTKQANESDWSMIQRLVRYCRSSTGKGGYSAHQSLDSNGNKVLMVSQPKDGNQADFSYVVQTQDSEVVSWQPHVSFQGILGSNEIHWNTVQKVSGYDQKVNMTQGLLQPYIPNPGGNPFNPLIQSTPTKPDPSQILQVGGAETFENASVNGALRYRTMGGSSSASLFNNALTGTKEAMYGINGATLVIQGDPNIMTPLQMVQVSFYYPVTDKNLNTGQQLHYTSGLYQISKIIHSIRAGEYLTTLELERPTFLTPASPQ